MSQTEEQLSAAEGQLEQAESSHLVAVARAQDRRQKLEERRIQLVNLLEGGPDASDQPWYPEVNKPSAEIDLDPNFANLERMRVQASEASKSAPSQALDIRMRTLQACIQECDNIAATLKRYLEYLDQTEEALGVLESTVRTHVQGEVKAMSENTQPATAPAGAERRNHTRVELSTAITLESDSNFYTGLSGDISEGGIFISTVNVLEAGTTISLSFTLPDGTEHQIEGRVRWVREWNDLTPSVMPGMGIEFGEISAQSQAAITEFVQRRESIYYDEDAA